MRKILCVLMIPLILFFVAYKTSNATPTPKFDSELFDQTAYAILNKPILTNSLKSIGLTEQEVSMYSEDIKKPFTETINARSIFPSELIGMFEKVLYEYKYEYNEWGFSKSYIQTVQRLGSENCKVSLDDLYSLFPEISEYKNKIKNISEAYKFINNPQKCYNIFQLPLVSDEKFFVIEYQSGGTNGACSVQLIKLLDDKKEIISEFEIQNYGAGEVIQYEDDFYYVFIQYNYNLKTDDGIRIHRLGANADTENILIRFLPEQYFWNNIFETQMDCINDIEQYINNIKNLITAEYLDNGMGMVGLLNGDEARNTSEFMTGINDYYKIDFANLGIPVYFTKGIFFPDTSHSSLCLISEFYIPDLQADTLKKIDGLGLDQETSKELTLIQLWFKEINGKIYTFRIYHISAYNYAFNVSLINGDKVTLIRTDLLSAQRKFILTEGGKICSILK